MPLSTAIKSLPLRLVFTTALVVGAATATAATTGANSGAIAFAQKLGNTAISDLTDPGLGDSARIKRMRELLRSSFDVAAVSRFVLGPYARSATPAQFREFEKLYEIYVAHNYAGLFKRYDGQNVRMQSERKIPGGDIAVYGTIFQRHGKPINLELRVRQEDGGFKVIDLEVEGVSMPLTHRKQFISVISQHNGRVSGLIDALRDADKRLESQASSE